MTCTAPSCLRERRCSVEGVAYPTLKTAFLLVLPSDE